MSEPTTAGEVMRVCLHHWDLNKNLVIPRCCLTGWEADLLVIRPSGWAEEVEIKISKSDFRAEWTRKSEKHEDLRLGGCRTVGMDYGNGSRYAYNGADLGDPRIFQRGSRLVIRDQQTLIRRFWFAMPLELAEAVLPEVPAEYGVLGVGRFGRVLREASILRPARKVTDAERIKALASTYHRFWSLTLRDQPDLTGLVAPGALEGVAL